MSEAQTPETRETPSFNQQNVEYLSDDMASMQEARAARRQRMEYIKFGVLVAILLGIIPVIMMVNPIIFDRIVPAIMGGSDSDEADTTANPIQDEVVPTGDAQNTEHLPIINTPGGDAGSGQGGVDEENPDEEAPTAVTGQTYVVQQGDTLNSIARQFNTTVEAIVAANDIPDPDNVRSGTTLVIPQP